MSKKIVIIGGGAAGFFAAQLHKSWYPKHQVWILEQTAQVLKKVRISGGGRCNVTHACFDREQLSRNYPRGESFLLSCFEQFQAQDMVAWLAQQGVPTKTEADGRMFPRSNTSETIVKCLYQGAVNKGVQVCLSHLVSGIERQGNQWAIHSPKHATLLADAVLVASGSSPVVWKWLQKLGVELISPVPSLFTFHIQDPRLTDLAGISLPSVIASVPAFGLEERGALLITHWGLSAPAILRLSAWGARDLAAANYRFELRINWSGKDPKQVMEDLKEKRQEWHKKAVAANPLYDIPTRLWRRLMDFMAMDERLRWAQIPKKTLQELHELLTNSRFEVVGKSTFKDEFVTAGGVALHQIDEQTLQHKHLPNLYFAGEVLDIDAITGGFNFQAAWTTAFIAAKNMGL
jgi:predicted Rossmann fold flavoprotein